MEYSDEASYGREVNMARSGSSPVEDASGDLEIKAKAKHFSTASMPGYVKISGVLPSEPISLVAHRSKASPFTAPATGNSTEASFSVPGAVPVVDSTTSTKSLPKIRRGIASKVPRQTRSKSAALQGQTKPQEQGLPASDAMETGRIVRTSRFPSKTKNESTANIIQPPQPPPPSTQPGAMTSADRPLRKKGLARDTPTERAQQPGATPSTSRPLRQMGRSKIPSKAKGNIATNIVQPTQPLPVSAQPGAMASTSRPKRKKGLTCSTPPIASTFNGGIPEHRLQSSRNRKLAGASMPSLTADNSNPTEETAEESSDCIQSDLPPKGPTNESAISDGFVPQSGDAVSVTIAARETSHTQMVAERQTNNEWFQDEMVAIQGLVDAEEIQETSHRIRDPSGFLVEATLVDEEGGNNMTDKDRAQLEEETRQRVIQEMILDAEAALLVQDFDETAKVRQRQRRNLCLCLTALLVLLSVVIGSLLGAASRRSGSPKVVILKAEPTISSEPSVNPTSFPTGSTVPSASPSFLPTAQPSSLPTSSPHPSAFPSLLPSQSSSLPSLSPSALPSTFPTSSTHPSDVPSTKPSESPTSSPTMPPDNNYCQDAQEVSIGDTVYIEDVFAIETFVPSFPETETYAPSPPEGKKSVWQPTATSQNLVPAQSPQSVNWQTWETVETEDIANQSSNIFDPNSKQYSDILDGLVYQRIFDCEYGMAYTQPGRWYKLRGAGQVTLTTCNVRTPIALPSIQVYSDVQRCPEMLSECTVSGEGYRYDGGCLSVSFDSVAGAEYLVLLTVQQEATPYSGTGGLAMTVLTNDNCARAYGLVSTGGGSIFGTTENATIDANISACGNAGAPTQPGLWYNLIGLGGLIKVDTCQGTALDTQISVFKASNRSCDNLVCVDGDDDFCSKQSSVTFDAELDASYYILVQGASSTGSFVLNLQEVPIELAHDFCPYAKPIEINLGEEKNVSVPMQYSTQDPEVTNSNCIGIVNGQDRDGFWYSLKGTGDEFSLSVNSLGAALISVFQGDCESFDCPFPAEQKIITFSSVSGTNYLIYVHYYRSVSDKAEEVLTIWSNAAR